MRNRTKIAIFSALLLFLAGLVLLLPHLLSLDSIRERVVRQVSADLASSVRVEEISWAWLPLPHAIVSRGLLENEELRIAVPRAEVYPGWRSLLGSQVRLGRVVLHAPDITIKKFPSLSETDLPELLPIIDVAVVDGSLHVAASSHWPQVSSGAFSITAIRADARVSRRKVVFSFSGTPSFGELFQASGELQRDGGHYKAELECRNLKLHEVLHSLAGDVLKPVDSLLNVRASVEGRGASEIEARIYGEFPCLLAYPQDKKILLNCGFADLSFRRTGSEMLLTVHEMEMREPGGKLAGTIGRSPGPDDSSPPLWTVALHGEDFDLDGIRGAVLAMWGENETAREVGDIVLAGKAGKASYAFRGTVADLQDIRNMKISAEEIDATIKLPVGELVLNETRGRMRIEDGRLFVRGDSARLGNSAGSNCDLVLGLTRDDHTLQLEVDLDADLAQLPEVLPRLIHSSSFLNELAGFRDISGRAQGRLRLGDHLEDLRVGVDVLSMQGRAGHVALPRDFSVAGGRLDITLDAVQWQDVRGTYGQHRIERTSGEVRLSGQSRLRLSRLDAVLSGPDLMAGSLSFLPGLDRALKDNLSSLYGAVTLRDTTISGMASDPSSWQANSSLGLDGLVLATPHLPAPVRIQKGRLRSEGRKLIVQECIGTMFKDDFALTADLARAESGPWLGGVSLRGRLGRQTGAWLKEKELIPATFFPRLPLDVDALEITLAAEKTSASGKVAAGTLAPFPARAEFSAEFSREGSPLRAAFRIFGQEERAAVSLDFPQSSREDLLFSWHGTLSDKTVTQLLDRQEVLQGAVVSGNFRLRLPSDPAKTSFDGELRVGGFRWPWAGRPGRYVDFREILLAGAGQDLQVRKLFCVFDNGESVQANGFVSRLADGFGVRLALSSPSLSQETLVDLAGDLERLDRDAGPAKQGKIALPWKSVRGTIRFDVAEFVSRHRTGPAREPRPVPLFFRPLQGEVRLYPGWRTATTITSGQLCCLEVAGEWFSDPELGRNALSLRTICPDSPPRFEQVLPCLGFPQDIIEGSFSLEGRLAGTRENWQEGQFDVHSDGGRILRMKLLSQIFSVVNITDLFSIPVQGDDPTSSRRGFPYSELVLKSKIRDNELIIDEAVVRGQGLNLFARGRMDISTLDMDFVVLVAPLKTIDAIFSRIPLLGRVIGGETGTLVTFPVAVKGNINDPKVTLLPPSAVGEGILNIVKRTLLLPFTILSPILPDMTPEQEKK